MPTDPGAFNSEMFSADHIRTSLVRLSVDSVNARGGPVSAARLGTASAEGADEQPAIATRARRLPSPRPFIVI